MSDENQEVYSLMIPTVNSNILLPNTNVAEVVPFSNVELFEDDSTRPNWYLGHLVWRGMDIPLVSIDLIKGETDAQANKRSRVAVTHTLNSNGELPYLAIVVQGIPRLSHVKHDNIQFVQDENLSDAEKMRVEIDSVIATIPDLDKLEAMVLEANEAA
ncbi:MAG: chemotaxis protein CheW [Kangiellaceae bacterium]|nr:chemotaxis protein CheW [Kangiellaceae bacterium]